MLQLTVLGGVFNFFGLMTAAVFIPFLKRDLGASDVAVGYALGIGAIGALAGSVIAGRLPRKWPLGRILWIAYALDGVLFIPVVFARNLPTAVVFLALTNACVTFEIAQIVGWRMRIIPEELVGRVFGAVRLVALIGTVPGSIAGGLLADHFGARVPIAISGVGYLVTALAVFPAMLALRRERR
jgi:MFS family permease